MVWSSLILVILGPIATAHSANFGLPALGSALAAIPALFASKRTRIGAAVACGIGLVVASANYPGYRAGMDRYIARSRELGIDTPEQNTGE